MGEQRAQNKDQTCSKQQSARNTKLSHQIWTGICPYLIKKSEWTPTHEVKDKWDIWIWQPFPKRSSGCAQEIPARWRVLSRAEAWMSVWQKTTKEYIRRERLPRCELPSSVPRFSSELRVFLEPWWLTQPASRSYFDKSIKHSNIYTLGCLHSVVYRYLRGRGENN